MKTGLDHLYDFERYRFSFKIEFSLKAILVVASVLLTITFSAPTHDGRKSDPAESDVRNPIEAKFLNYNIQFSRFNGVYMLFRTRDLTATATA